MSGRKKRSSSQKSRKVKITVAEQPRRSTSQKRKPRPAKVKSGNRNRGVQSGGINRISFASAPVNVGAKYGPSFVKGRAGNVQANADFDPSDGSERVVFCDTLTTQIKAGSSTVTDGFGGTATYQVQLTPTGISPRLIQYEEMYQWYAIRDMLIEYCPLISTATSVGYNIGIVQNIDAASAVGTPTPQDINELSPSMAGPVYLPNSMKFSHRGIKLWSTADANTFFSVQGYFQCVLDGTPVASTVYGKLRISGTIDFYKSISPFTSDPSFILGNRVRYKTDPIQRQLTFDAYLHAMAKVADKFGLVLKPELLKITEEEKLSDLSDTDKLKLLEEQFDGLQKRVLQLDCATPNTPHTYAEAGNDDLVINNHLSDSVHIPRSMASQMLSLMGKK